MKYGSLHLHQPIESLLDAIPGDGRFDLLPDRPLRAAIAGRGGAFLRHAVSPLRFHFHVERFVGAKLHSALPIPPAAGRAFLFGYAIDCCCHLVCFFLCLKTLYLLNRRRGENVTAKIKKSDLTWFAESIADLQQRRQAGGATPPHT